MKKIFVIMVFLLIPLMAFAGIRFLNDGFMQIGGKGIQIFSAINYDDYAFYSINGGRDRVTKQALVTTLTEGRPLDMDSGVLAEEDEATIGADGLLTYGAYTNLMPYSEDISNASWQDSGFPILTPTTIKAQAEHDGVYKAITTLDATLYTFSFKAKVESGGQLTGYQFRHVSSATGSFTSLTLTYKSPSIPSSILFNLL